MENEKISSASSDEEFQELTMVSNLFEQTMLLVGQAFQSITYYRRHNILSTLIDNPSKVKEILKNADATLDGADNIYLFGDKFEVKLLKDTNAKQKSKLLFSGLQRSKSSNNTRGTSYSGNPSYISYNQPFRESPLPRTNGGRGHFLCRAAQRGKKNLIATGKILIMQGLQHVHALVQHLFPQEQRSDLPVAGRLKHFLKNWKVLTSDPHILEIVEGYQIPSLSIPQQVKPPAAIQFSEKDKSLIDLKIQGMLEKGAIRIVKELHGQFLSPLFLVERKDSGYRPVVNLKKLNRNIPMSISKWRVFLF